jgi:hypothetical protein
VIGSSRERVEADRWVAFRSHFDINAFHCQPGVTGGHEKGGVEGDIGRFPRNHWCPFPRSTRCTNSTSSSMTATAPTTTAVSDTAVVFILVSKAIEWLRNRKHP